MCDEFISKQFRASFSTSLFTFVFYMNNILYLKNKLVITYMTVFSLAVHFTVLLTKISKLSTHTHTHKIKINPISLLKRFLKIFFIEARTPNVRSTLNIFLSTRYSITYRHVIQQIYLLTIS